MKRGPKPKTPRKRGRPPLYTVEIANKILERMSAGETLRSICRDKAMPAAPTVRKWVLDDPGGFSARYARARQMQAEHMADEILEIADKGSIIRARLRVDTRKFLMMKLHPKIYGERVEHEHLGVGGGPMRVIHEMSTDQLADVVNAAARRLTAGAK